AAPNPSADTASCAHPTLAPAELSIVKTLAEVDGAPYVAGSPVFPGETLRYNIAIANDGGTVAALATGDIVETVPEHAFMVIGADNDFSCSGTSCVNTDPVSIPAGESVDLGFVVEVLAPLPAGATTIHNAV